MRLLGLRNYSAAYLRHLYKCDEILASRLATFHNVYFYRTLMIHIRPAIEQGRLMEYRKEFMAKYRRHRASVHDDAGRQENNNGSGIVTLDTVSRDPKVKTFIQAANEQMDALGYTEHGYRHGG